MTNAPRTPPTPLSQADAKPVHFIYHVSKCAGQTVHCHLSTHAPTGTYHRLKKRKGPSRFFLPRYDLAGMPHADHLRAIGGHFIGNSIERIFSGRQIVRSILLRDPVSQFVSHYNFRMMRYLSQGWQTYSPEIAYQARPRNFVTHYILRNFLEMSWPRLLLLSPLEKYVAVNRFLSTFWFVGDYTRCNELIAVLAPSLGVPATARAENTCGQWQRRVGWKPLKVGDLPRRIIDQIRRENAVDQLLWETWRDGGRARVTSYPHHLSETPFAELVARETRRLAYQVRRRLHRGWKVPAGNRARHSPHARPVPDLANGGGRVRPMP